MDFQLARKHMVDSQVRTNDVADPRIQDVFNATPRELFLPKALREQAYVERELAYAPGRAMLTARDLAKLLVAANPRPGELVLDVGCGSGYTAALLAGLVEMVVAVESDEDLAAAAQSNLAELGVSNAAIVSGPLPDGAAEQGPFDLILIAALIETRPEQLLGQLKDGGRLATIMPVDGVPRGVIFDRSGDAFSKLVVFDAASRTVLSGFEEPRRFKF